MPVLCIAAFKVSDLIHTGCHTNTPICTHFAMFVMLYHEKKIPQPPPRELLYQ